MPLTLHPEFTTSSKSQRYLLAISGGRDSVALLYVLLDAGYRNLVLCHLNHQLRGEASNLDAQLVQDLAESHQLPHAIENVDVLNICKATGESMELAARNARHRFFAQCAEQFQCADVLLAHHADDQVETILFNLLRGSGGLKGMQFLKLHDIEDYTLRFLRPLLLCTRDDIDQFIQTKSIAYREDESNQEAIATRNRLRNEAIPLLNEIMGRDICPALLRATQISETKEVALAATLKSHQLRDPQGRLFLPKLKNLPLALQKMALQDYLKTANTPNITEELLAQSAALIDDQTISKINLPGGTYLRRKEKRLFISN